VDGAEQIGIGLAFFADFPNIAGEFGLLPVEFGRFAVGCGCGGFAGAQGEGGQWHKQTGEQFFHVFPFGVCGKGGLEIEQVLNRLFARVGLFCFAVADFGFPEG